MTNLDAALSLGAQGLPVFPCQIEGATPDGAPLHKQPCPGVMWRSAATDDPGRIRKLWDRFPNAAPGVHLERSPYFVIDCDPPKNAGQQDGIEWFRSACAEHDFEIETVPIVQTPSGGWHVYFRRPPGAKVTNSRGSLPPKEVCGVDVRGAGGYVIGAGSMIDTGGYELLDGPEIEAAPLPPDWLVEILTSRRSAAVVAPSPRLSPRQTTGREEAYASRGLEEEARIVAATPPGARNSQLNESAFKVGRMVGAGWLPYGEARGALVSAVAGWKDARKTLGTLDRALAAGCADPRDPLPEDEHDERAADLAAQIIQAHAPRFAEVGGELVDNETGEIVQADPAASSSREFPDHLMTVPGLVGDIMGWILSTSRRPVPALALGAALTIVGTASGRQFAGPTRSGTHLFVLGLAPTATGKDHPLQCIRRVLKAASMAQHIGPDDFTSASALNRTLTSKPLCVCPVDEFGAFLARVNSKKASTHERAISACLRKTWGASFGAMTTPAYAQSNAVEIEAPALSVFGVSTSEEFYRALEAADVDNGVLNRFMLLSTSVRPEDRDPALDPSEVPTAISDRLRAIGAHSGEAFFASLNVSRCTGPQVVIPWSDAAAKAVYADLSRRVVDLGDTSPGHAAFYGRTAEMALRLATIRAIGRSPFAMVTVEDMQWGADVALWSADAMIKGAAEHMAENEHQAMAQRVLKVIREAGGKIKKRDLWRRMDHVMRWQDLDNLIKSLVVAEQVKRVSAAPGRMGGRPSEWFVIPAD